MRRQFYKKLLSGLLSFFLVFTPQLAFPLVALAGVTPQTITVTTPAPANAIYGNTFDVAATASSTLTVTITATGGCSMVDADTVKMTSGTVECVVHYNQPGDATFDVAPEQLNNVTAQRQAITVTAATNTKIYDGNTSSIATPTLTSGSIVAGDSATYSQVYNDKNQGTNKTLIPSVAIIDGGSVDVLSNYDVTLVNDTTGVINVGVLTVTAVGINKVYDSTTGATVIYSTDKVNDDIVDVSGTATFADANVGTGKTISVTGISIGGADSGNYNLFNTTANTTADITARSITATADAKSKTYNDADPSLTYQATGTLQGADTFSGSLTRNAGEDAGTYAITQGTLALSSNYALTYVGANLTINKIALTVTAENNSKTYGDANPAFTSVYSGFVNGENQSVVSGSPSLTTTATQFSDAGTYAITTALGDLSATNYSFSLVNGVLTINKANPTVNITPYTVTYNGSSHTATGTATGVQSESLSGLDLSGTTHTDANAYNDSWTFTDVTGNYNNASGNVTNTINKAAAVINVLGFSGVYDGQAHGATGSATGVLSEVLDLLLDLGQSYTNVPGGTANWIFAGNTNYNSATGGVSIDISKADQTLTFDALSDKNYGDSSFTVSATTSSGLTVTFTSQTTSVCTVSGTTVTILSAGTCTIRASQSGNGNYNASVDIDRSFVVATRPITITAEATNKWLGSSDPTFTYQITSGSLVSGDNISGSLARDAGTSAGTYPITQGSLTAGSNYAITLVSANFKILPLPVVTSPLADATTTQSTTITVTTTENASCTYSVDSGSTVAMGTTGATSHSQALSNLANGSHSVVIACTDTLSNTSTSVSRTWNALTSSGSTIDGSTASPTITSSVDGQADIPSGITNITLSNSTVLDLSLNLVTDITEIPGSTGTLDNFTSGDLSGADLSQSFNVGGSSITVAKAIKLESGVNGQPLVITNTSLTSVTTSIPDGTTILGSSSWNGTLMPAIFTTNAGSQPSSLYSVTGSIIELGSSSEVLLFDRPVTIVLPQNQGEAAYKAAGSSNWIRITNICGGTFDNPTSPSFPGECYITNSTSTKILTYHFTSFGTLVFNGNGPDSAAAKAAPNCTEQQPESAPRLISVRSTGLNEVTLTWSKAENPVTYYLVAYGTQSGSLQYGNPNVGGSDTTSYTVKGLSGGKTYYFKVRAGNNCMPGEYSNEIAVTPLGLASAGEAEGFQFGVLGSTTVKAADQAEYVETQTEVEGTSTDQGEPAVEGDTDQVAAPQGFIQSIKNFFSSIFRSIFK